MEERGLGICVDLIPTGLSGFFTTVPENDMSFTVSSDTFYRKVFVALQQTLRVSKARDTGGFPHSPHDFSVYVSRKRLSSHHASL